MAASVSPTTGILASPGIGSNLDVNSIISGLMQAASAPVTTLQNREASYQATLTAYGTLKGAVSQFQGAMAGLANAAQFNSVTATPNDPGVLSASANSSAAPGNYAVTVNHLAQAQTLVAAGQSSATTAIGTGATTTLTFQYGTISGGSLSGGQYSNASFTPDATQATESVTIDSSDNSLFGIRDAINAANIGVTATVINDGSSSPYRLVLSSNDTGAAKAMRISVSGDSSIANLLGQDPAGTQNLTQTSVAQDAALTINGIDITSPSNTVTGAIQGVTLTLNSESSTTLNVARSSSATQNAVQAFVQAYNALDGELDTLGSYNSSTKQAGLLQGDFTVQAIQGQLREALSSPSAGGSGAFSVLSQIGVSFQKDGSLALDTTKLGNAMTANFSDIAGLFAAVGKATDSSISYVSSTGNTQPGTYAIAVTRLATHGGLTGSAPAGTTITAGVNDTLNLTIDGASTTVTLLPGSYSADSLAAMVQSAINGNSVFSSAGVAVTATQSGGTISIGSNSYGSSSQVSVTGGNGLTNLLGSNSVSSAGLDVAGTINGVAAGGSGQFLTGALGDASEGLKVQVAGGSTGSRGSVSYSQGYAVRLNALANNFLDSQGVINAATDGINSTISDIENQISDWNDRLTAIQANYQAQFTALDTMISSLKSTSNFLTQQLANLPTIGSTSKSN
ncbi:MAG TPA: flagellar filament capping protein FliD [Burkholderiales bacterium]|nr:flagellar filament capping protein FliD [Burkholderiales bacterium]